jgi:hypothetical protein
MIDAAQIDAMLPAPRLWLGESAEDLANLRAALQKEIKPNGIIESIFLYDIAELVLQMLRCRRIKTSILVKARPAALTLIIQQLLSTESGLPVMKTQVKELADAWFGGGAKKNESAGAVTEI